MTQENNQQINSQEPNKKQEVGSKTIDSEIEKAKKRKEGSEPISDAGKKRDDSERYQ